MSSNNLFTTNKFKFNFTGDRFKDNDLEIAITGINVPGLQLGTIPHPTTTRIIDRPGDSLVFNDLTIEFLITENFEEWVFIYNWIKDLRDFNEATFNNTILSDGKLVLLTNKLNPNIIITFQGMFPVDLADVDLTLNTADGEPARGTATFKYINFDVTADL